MMTTYIKTIHEESSSEGTRTLGALLNYSSIEDWHETLFYTYREGMYVFFNTMTDLFDYLLYGENKMKRAYLEEEEFDKYYSIKVNDKLISVEIDGTFSDRLIWN
jgi:hypothetical protein